MDSNIIKSSLFVSKLNYHSISDLVIDRLKHNSNDNCFIDCKTDRKWTKEQVLDSSLNFAYYLINDCKLTKGDIVCFVANNSDIHAIGMLGVFMAGGVYCSLLEDSTESEIQTNFQTINPLIVVCIESKYEFIKTLSKESLIKKILLIGETVNKRNEFKSLEEIIKIQRNSDIVLPTKTDLDHIASLQMTSGSTGRPKAVIKTNANLLSTVEAIQHREISEITPEVIFFSKPFVHQMGLKILLAVIAGGGQLAIMDEYKDFKKLWNKIYKYSVTNILFVPTQLNYMVKNYDKCAPYLKSLRNVVSGSSPLSASTYEAIVSKYSFDVFSNRYGMTEVGWATQVRVSEAKQLANCETVGKVCPNTEIKIIDEMGNSLPANMRGEICIRGGQVTPGYLNNPSENAKLFTSDGFLKSGDIGYYDSNDDFFIVGRIKDIIKVEGDIVAPAELENILVSHPHVLNAAVIGIPDEKRDEIPMAFVTVDDIKNVTIDELIGYVNSRVNDIKQLRGGLKILDAFPLTPLGKISKQNLKQMSEMSKH